MTDDHDAALDGAADQGHSEGGGGEAAETETPAVVETKKISLNTSSQPGFSYTVWFSRPLSTPERNAALAALIGALDPGTTYQLNGHGLKIHVIPDSDDADDNYAVLQHLRELFRPIAARTGYIEVENHALSYDIRLTLVGEDAEPANDDEVCGLLRKVPNCLSVGIVRGQYVMACEGQANQWGLTDLKRSLQHLGISVELRLPVFFLLEHGH